MDTDFPYPNRQIRDGHFGAFFIFLPDGHPVQMGAERLGAVFTGVERGWVEAEAAHIAQEGEQDARPIRENLKQWKNQGHPGLPLETHARSRGIGITG